MHYFCRAFSSLAGFSILFHAFIHRTVQVPKPTHKKQQQQQLELGERQTRTLLFYNAILLFDYCHSSVGAPAGRGGQGQGRELPRVNPQQAQGIAALPQG